MDSKLFDVKGISAAIRKFAAGEVNRAEMLQDLVVAAVWHSIAHQQITPAKELFAAVKGKDKEAVIGMLTKYGTVHYDKAKGILHSATKAKSLNGPEKANEVVAGMPNLWDEFPPKPAQYKDQSFKQIMAIAMNRAQKLLENGKHVIFETEEEKRLYDQLTSMNLVTK